MTVEIYYDELARFEWLVSVARGKQCDINAITSDKIMANCLITQNQVEVTRMRTDS